MRWIDDAALDHLSAVADEPDLSGTRYRLVRAIGRGGMGAVYAALDRELGREVALKVTAGAPGALAERLRREARVLARLEHPGIVPVHDSGTLPDGRSYYVMKLVRGESLVAWRRRHGERRAALRLFQRVCEAVAFAHARGVIHRDLKPENVMVGSFGEALVMDWGIAKELEVARAPGSDRAAPPEDAVTADTLPIESGAQTMAGTVMGTPAYMPPEQARGDVALLDARSDVYSLGAILYFLLVERPPFRGGGAREVLARVIASSPDPLDDDVPRPLASICARALHKEPAARYEGASELGDDVGRWLEGLPVTAHAESAAERILRFGARHRAVLSLLAAYMLLRVLLAYLT